MRAYVVLAAKYSELQQSTEHPFLSMKQFTSYKKPNAIDKVFLKIP